MAYVWTGEIGPRNGVAKSGSCGSESVGDITMDWKDRRVVVTGGASFIGSHLVDRLTSRGADVLVLDDLSSGLKENLVNSPSAKLVEVDLEYNRLSDLRPLFKDREVVFHLAATHGGRGYIDSHPADVCSNLAIDHHVFECATLEDVESVVFSSSACVYPPSLQSEYESDYLLREEDASIGDLTRPLSADLEYGWAKLMGEVQLSAFVRQYGLKGCSLRFVTAYGERENETHAIIALIYKAFQRMDPYEIWGTGEQSRDFTYVGDIVDGTILAAERVTDGSPINLGTGKRFRLRVVAESILAELDFHPQLRTDPAQPTGVVNRALDISRAKEVLGWSPRVDLKEGLRKTIAWYQQTHRYSGKVSERLLMERSPVPFVKGASAT